MLNISAFNGNAQSYVVHPDGRVVVDHSSESWGEVYNFFGILREHSNMSEKEILKLSEEFKEGHTDAMLINRMERITIWSMRNPNLRTGSFWDLSRLISLMPYECSAA